MLPHSKILPGSLSKSAPNILIDWDSAVGRFGLVKPGNLSKFAHSCLVFVDIHKYFISCTKNN